MPDRYAQMAGWLRELELVRAASAERVAAEIRQALSEPCPCCSEPAPRQNLDDEWCVFYGGSHPDDAAGCRVTDDMADAEEHAQWLIESGVAVRTVSYGPWQVKARCSSCGSVLDGGDDCCDGRVAEIEAGAAALRREAT